MMDTDRLAATLAEAVRSRTAIPPLTDQVALDIEQAYDVQDTTLELLDPGGTRRVAKLGLTSRAKQQQMAVDEPLYGWFVSGSAVEPGITLEAASLIQPRVEPEIAFLTGTELGGHHVTTPEVLAATAGVMPALDVLDSRFAGYRFTLPDVVADDGSAARYVVGDPVPLGDRSLPLLGCVFERNGELVDTAAGASVLGHPAAAVAWFVRKLAERGRSLPAGSIVLAGSLTAAIPVEAGDVVRASIGQLGHVELQVT